MTRVCNYELAPYCRRASLIGRRYRGHFGMQAREKMAWRLLKRLNDKPLVKDNPRSEAFYALRYGTLKKFNNYLKLKRHYRAFDETVATYPYTLRIEPVNACNLKCPLCPTGVGQIDRPRSVMSEAQYQSLLDELGDYLFFVRMYIWGEPLLNKRLWRLVTMTEERGIGSEISTNLSVPLTDQTIDRLIEARLSWMIVSVDGATPETYRRYRRGGNLELVVANTRRIADRKRVLGIDTPYLEWQFIPMRHNEHEMDEIVRMGRDNGVDGVRFKPGRFDKTSEIAVAGTIMGPLIAQWKPTKTKIYHASENTGAAYHDFHCPFLWGHAVVHADGGIGSCCESHLLEHDGGNLAKGSFVEQWNGPAFRRMRQVAVGRTVGAHDDATPCANCTMFAKPFAQKGADADVAGTPEARLSTIGG